jgi:DNA-binding transcriptional LysR family regulator
MLPSERVFGSTVCALVSHGLAIAIVDEFTLAADQWPQLRALDIAEPTAFETSFVHRKDVSLSSAAARFVAALRAQMEAVARLRNSRKK